MYNSFVNADQQLIDDMPCRPRIGEASASTLIAAIAGGLLARPIGVLIGGAAGNAIANQPQPLEMAIRDHLNRLGFEVVFFYPAPRSIKVTFWNSGNAYWTVESSMPDYLSLPPEDTLDWLYGNFVQNELPKVMGRITPVG